MYRWKFWKKPFPDTIKEFSHGEDPDFGRKTLTHNYGKPTPIEKAPFYAFESTVAMLATYAGIGVNESPSGESLWGTYPGLYAAGEVTGGFHGAGYMTRKFVREGSGVWTGSSSEGISSRYR